MMDTVSYEVTIYDENVDSTKIIGTNRLFLERELPHIAFLMRPSVEALVREVEVIVIANGSHVFQCVPELMPEEQILIDLFGYCEGTTPESRI